MPKKYHKPEEIVSKLRQVDVLTSQGRPVADAIRQIGVTEITYYRWRKEYGGLKTDQVRRINDGMGGYVADRVARLMMKKGFPVVGSRILVMGLSFKENCPDLRNSKVIDVIAGLKEYHAEIDTHDPWVDPVD